MFAEEDFKLVVVDHGYYLLDLAGLGLEERRDYTMLSPDYPYISDSTFIKKTFFC